MISSDQLEPALKALQALIAQARHQAYDAGAKQVGELLDDLEYLPQLLTDYQLDRTRDFRDALEGIAQKHPACRYIVEKFLHPVASH